MIAAQSPAYTPGVVHRERAAEHAGAPTAMEIGRMANWGAALIAGLAAGVLLLVLELLLAPSLHQASMWAPIRMMASVAIGERALEPPLTFDAGIMIVGLLVHFAVCVAFAVILAPLLRWFDRGPAALFGAAYGILTYIMVFHAAAQVRPTLAGGRGPASILGHVLFGVALAALYRTIARVPEAPIPDPPPAQIHRSESVNTG